MTELEPDQHIIFNIMEKLGMSLALHNSPLKKDKPAGKMYLLAGEFYGTLTDLGKGTISQNYLNGEKIKGSVEDFVRRVLQEQDCAGILPIIRQTKDLLESLGLTSREYKEGTEILVYK